MTENCKECLSNMVIKFYYKTGKIIQTVGVITGIIFFLEILVRNFLNW